MPHLVMCKRYWRIGGDELPLPASLSIFWRFVWMVLLVLVFTNVTKETTQCHDGVDAYMGTSLAIFIVSILCEILVMKAGSVGTMIELDKRNDQLELYLSAHYVLSFLQIGLCLWGIAILNRVFEVPCATEVVNNNNADVIIITLVVITQLIDVMLMFFCGWLLSSRRVDGLRMRGGSMFASDLEMGSSDGSLHAGRLLTEGGSDAGGEYDNSYESTQQRTWSNRCQQFCRITQAITCGLFGSVSNMQDIEAVAVVLTNFFHHNGFLDVVPSDAVAGILLVRLQQRSHLQEYTADDRRESLSMQALPPRTRMTLRAARQPMDKLKGTHQKLIYECFRGSQYAFAMYTWMMLLYAKPVSGPCRLCYSSGECADGSSSVCGCCEGRDSGRNSSSEMPLATSSSSSSSSSSVSSPPLDSVGITSSQANDIESYRRVGAREDMIHGDNCCQAHRAAVKAVLRDIPGAEIAYCNFSNSTTMKPYGLFVDHKDRCVVLAIRGTLSLEDCLTDVICDASELTNAGYKYGFDGTGKWVHAGFLRGAEAIVDDLLQRNLLTPLLGQGPSQKQGQGQEGKGTDQIPAFTSASASASTGGYRERGEEGTCHAYGLRVVGHSLGAGVAFIVTLLLQSRYPQVTCTGYGTPGSLADAALSKECASWMTSVVLDDDLIARVGVGALNHLRDQVLDCISRSKCNKTYIMQTLFRDFPASQFLYSPDETPQSSFKDAVATFTRVMKQRNATELAREHGGTSTENLTIPGRIVHLVKPGGNSDMAEAAYTYSNGGDYKGGATPPGEDGVHASASGAGASSAGASGAGAGGRERRPPVMATASSSARSCRNCYNCCSPRPVYIPQEVDGDAFAELIISSNMAVDHFPDRYVYELKALHESWASKHSDIVLNRA